MYLDHPSYQSFWFSLLQQFVGRQNGTDIKLSTDVAPVTRNVSDNQPVQCARYLGDRLSRSESDKCTHLASLLTVCHQTTNPRLRKWTTKLLKEPKLYRKNKTKVIKTTINVE